MKAVFRLVMVAVFFFALVGCAVKKPDINVPRTPPPIVMPKERPQVALVLGSGGARGYAHLGVIKVLRDAGVPINLIAGASAGTIFGAVYADTGSASKTIKTMMAAKFWDMADMSNFPDPDGLMTGYHLENFLLQHLHAKTFKQLKIPVVVATTDIYKGKVYKIGSGPIAPAVEASAAVPVLVRPSYLYGRDLVDGGVTDPVPVDLVKPYHPKLIIAVDIDPDLVEMMPGSGYGMYNRVYAVMGRELSIRSAQGADVVIYPKVGRAGTFNINNKYKLFHEGEVATRKALPKILRLMKQRGIKRQYGS
jgi:NTE family protein